LLALLCSSSVSVSKSPPCPSICGHRMRTTARRRR
jgi:hypothetical protein